MLMAFYSLAAASESFTERFEEANALLEKGDVEGALGAYRDLQIDAPESDALYYGIGCAQYEQALNKLALEAGDEASEAFETSKASFEKARLSPNALLRRNAGYNLANADAQLAKLTVAAGNHEDTVAAFERAIQGYEGFLRRYPAHEGAQNNLDHMRFLLKKMLQNPPPSQEKEEQTEEGTQEQKQDDSQQESSGEQEAQQQDGQQEEGSSAMGERSTAEDETAEAEPEQRQDVEAILQSLEDQDNREQQKTRPGQRNVGITQEWW